MKKGLIPTLFLLLFSFSFAQVGSNLSPEQEAEAKVIEGLLISPCCWRQPVSVHFSGASDEVRTEVRQMLASGLSRDEILDRYVAEYGERILAKPKAEGFSALAYFLPAIFLLVGGGVAVVVIRKLRPSRNEDVGTPERSESPVTGAYSKKLEKELWG